jgi:ribosomal protein S12 methylthiotransferase
MHRSLLREGYQPADSPYDADYHVINSCSFIESAREETIQTVLEGANIKESAKDQKLVLVGCFTERYSQAVKDELPEVDFSFGTGQYHRAGSFWGKDLVLLYCTIPWKPGPLPEWISMASPMRL